MKKNREKEAGLLGGFCVVTALALDVVCVLFLLDVTQKWWILNFIMGLGILLHIALALQGVTRRKWITAWISLALVLGYAVGIVFYNL